MWPVRKRNQTIVIELCFDDGLIRSIASSGHATKERGTAFSICCALVSANLRSFSRFVTESAWLVVDGDVPKPGEFRLQIKRIDPGRLEWFRGLCELTLRGLGDIAEDFPRNVVIAKKE